MYTDHRLDLILRLTLFLIVSYLALAREQWLIEMVTIRIVGFPVYQILCLGVVAIILYAMLPLPGKNVSWGKIFGNHCKPDSSPDRESDRRLQEYAPKMNTTSFRALIFFLILLIVPGCLYYYRLIDRVGVLLFSLWYFVGDAVCVTLWCPFRNWLAHNKCCNTCSIFNWGYIGMAGPLVFIPGFWTWSLVILSALAVVQWEYLRAKHPERFWELTNCNLRCTNCQGNRGFCLRH